MEFIGFPKLARLNREIVISEKIDGTNAQVCILPRTEVFSEHAPFIVADFGADIMFAGSRTRWITPEDDNYGFAKWVKANAEELFKLGPGQHFGEWWGQGIQRKYGLAEKRFSLFNTGRWFDTHDPMAPRIGDEVKAAAPACCHVVPVLYQGLYEEFPILSSLTQLARKGSVAAPGFLNPEGIVIYHTAAKQSFKVTLENDSVPKSRVA